MGLFGIGKPIILPDSMAYKINVFLLRTVTECLYSVCTQIQSMVNRIRPRIDVTVSPNTIATLDDLAWFGSRGRKIDEAVSYYRRVKKI